MGPLLCPLPGEGCGGLAGAATALPVPLHCNSRAQGDLEFWRPNRSVYRQARCWSGMWLLQDFPTTSSVPCCVVELGHTFTLCWMPRTGR